MGRKFTIPYGLFKAQGFVNPFLANQTGFTDDDLELLFTALENAFQFDQSAARPAGSMNPRALIIFKHDSALGSAPSHKLFDLVTVKKKDGIEVPRSINDYDVAIDEAAMPEEPDRAEYNFADPDGLDRAIYLEELKKYNRRLEEYEKNAPKLFGLILQYLSDESLEAENHF